MNKGPVVCRRYLEEFEPAERTDTDFLCPRCHQHPDWHERAPTAAQAGQPLLIIFFVQALLLILFY